MTTALYYQDPLQLQFDAEVTAVTEDAKGVDVELDCTAFYPEGGGQPADTGTIDGKPVLHVHKSDGRILHRMATAPTSQRVHGEVDSDHRRDYMQQHTGQHILSSALLRIGGLQTVAVHQGEEYTTIEVDGGRLDHDLTWQIEEEANRVIELDLPVTAKEVDEDQVANYPLRRPPQKTGRLRLVFVGEIDCAACGGVHLPRTGMVRLIRHLGNERIRGRTRTYWKIGDRALGDYREKSSVCSWITDAYSVPTDQIVERLQQEQEKRDALEKELEGERSRRAALLAESIDRMAEEGSAVRVGCVQLDEPAAMLRLAAEALVERTKAAGSTRKPLAFCLVGGGEDRVHWSIGVAGDVQIDFNAIRRTLLPLIDGKGGGKPPLWQGVGSNARGVAAFLDGFARLVET